MNWKQVQCEVIFWGAIAMVVIGWASVFVSIVFCIGCAAGGGTIDGPKEAQRHALIAKVYRLETQAKQP